MDTKTFIFVFFVSIIAVSVEGRKKNKKKCDPSKSQNISDFDYLVFSVSWIPAVCFAHVRAHNTINRSCQNLDKNKQWTIHGLWPSIIDKESPKNCDCLKYNSTEITSLKPDLETKWTDIEHKDGNKFWKHEYERHGSCARSINSLNTQFKYFDQALKLFDRYNFTEILKNASISLGDHYKEANIVEKVGKQLGKQINLTCINNSAKQADIGSSVKKFFLHSIILCFDKSLSLIDCVQNSTYKSDCPSARRSKKIEFSDFKEFMKKQLLNEKEKL